MMKTMLNMIWAVLLICATTSAESGSQEDGWQSLRQKSIGMGCRSELIDNTLGACRQRGLSSEESGRLLAPVYKATEEGLPAECIYARIDEGLAKKIEVSRIEAAAQNRLECLRKARKLVTEAGNGRPGGGRGGGQPMLVSNVALALESGVPADVLQSVFHHQGRMRYGRLAQVVEAGETLYLSGLESEQLQLLMTDFLDRNLNRHEMDRVIELVKRGLSEDREFDAVYNSIWTDSGKDTDE